MPANPSYNSELQSPLASQLHNSFRADVLDLAPVVIAVQDTVNNIVWANKAFQKASGLSFDDIAGKKCFSLWGLDKPCSGCPVLTAIATGEEQEAELAPKIKADREVTQVSWYSKANPIKTEDGNVIGAIVVIFDITERKLVEEALRVNEERYRQLFENMSSGVAVYEAADNGEDFIFSDFNKAAEKIDQVSRKDLIGKSISKVFPGIAESGLLEVFRRVRRTGVPEHLPVSLYKDGRISGWRDNYVYRLPAGEIVTIFEDLSEHKRAEEELRFKNTRLELASSATNIGYWDWDLIDNTVYFSPQWKRQLGFKDHDLPNRIEELVSRLHPDDYDREMKALADYIEGRIPEYALEFRLRHKDGSYRWIYTRAEKQLNESGEPYRLIGCHIDITEQMLIEKRLHETIMQQMETARAANVGLWDWKLQTNEISYSAEWKKQIGYQEHEIGNDFEEWRRRIHPDDLEPTLKKIQKSITEKTREYKAEFRLLHKDGSYRWVLSQGAVLQDETGAAVRMLGSHVDITERKQAEEEILKSRERLTSLVDNLIDSVVVTDRDGTIKFVNNAACLLFGKKKENLVGTVFALPADMDGMPEIEINLPDGQIHYAEIKATGSYWDGESAYLISLRDITGKKHAMAEHEKTNEQLRQSQKLESIGKLAGGIAHDFNNMLSVIIGYGEELQGSLHTTDPLREFVNEMVDAGKRSALLTRQLLAFSRRQTLEPEVLNLNSIVKNLEPVLRRLIGEDILLKFLPTEPLDNVKVDPGQIEQVIVNLAVNSRDAMPQGGKLFIETMNFELDEQFPNTSFKVIPGSYVMLSVADSGCGMDEETRGKVFEPFFTTKDKGKGTGLGLSTVYGIVKQSGGYIWVYSEPGRGTTFKIYLPKTTEARSAVKTVKADDVIEGKQETILVVEDEPSLGKLCDKILKKLNYNAMIAASAGEALFMVEEKGLRPDLIITDVVMPEMSGKLLTDRLKKTLPDIKVLFMSGYTDDAIVHHGILNPGTPFIQKPFNKRKLGEAIRSLLDR